MFYPSRRIGLVLVIVLMSFGSALNTQAQNTPRVLGIEAPVNIAVDTLDIAPEENIFELKDHSYRITKRDGWEFVNALDILAISKPGGDTNAAIVLMIDPTPNATAADARLFYGFKNLMFQTGAFHSLNNFTDEGTSQFNGRSARKLTLEDPEAKIQSYLFPYGDRSIVLMYSYGATDLYKAEIDAMLQSLVIGPQPTVVPPTAYKVPDYDVTLTPSANWTLGTTTPGFASVVDLSHNTYANVFASLETDYVSSFYTTREDLLKRVNNHSQALSVYDPESSYELILQSSDLNVKINDTLNPAIRSEYLLRQKNTGNPEVKVIFYDIFTDKIAIRAGLYIYSPTADLEIQAIADFQSGILDKIQTSEAMWQPPTDVPPIIVPEPQPIPQPVPPRPTIDPNVIQLKSDDHVRGNLNAPIVLVEYSDLECPFCKMFHPTLKSLQDSYSSQVAWVHRPFPLNFHANAQKEAEAAECVAAIGGNDKFWSFIDAIYDRTTSNGTGFAFDKLAPLAVEVGVDEAQFNDCLNSGQFANKVADSLAEGQAAGVMGTPATFVLVNGKAFTMIPGAMPRMSVEQSIKEALASIGITSNYDTTATKTLTVINKQLLPQVLGRIILKVEDRGRAYYINPKSKIGRFLGRAEDAYQVMREEGVGITNANLRKIPVNLTNLSGVDSDSDGLPDTFEEAIGTNKYSADSDNDTFPDKVELQNGYDPMGPGRQIFDTTLSNKSKGIIFLQVEGRGQAWYVNPVDGRRYFLGRAEDAYQIMRALGLGISNTNFNSLSRAE